MSIRRLQGTWFYEKADTDCKCTIITAGRTRLVIGEELYCIEHQRIARVTRIMPASERDADALCAVDDSSEAVLA